MIISYFTKLAGVSFRQDAVAAMKPKTKLKLRREADNEYDPNAVAVDALIGKEWTHIGYIAKDSNETLAMALDKGTKVDIEVTDLTGGTKDKTTRGVNVSITYEYRDESFDHTQFKKLLPAIGSGLIYFDEANHVYYSEEGKQLTSGSKYEDRFTPEFNTEYPARALAKTTGVDKELIKAVWSSNGDVSAAYGTAVHAGLELYYNYQDVLEKLDAARERDHTASNYMPASIGSIVDQHRAKFKDKFTGRLGSEMFVRSGDWCGFVDLIHFVDDTTVDLYDYKIIRELKKVKYDVYGELTKYSLQQNFYRTIIEKNNYKVRNMYLNVYTDGEWHEHEIKRVELKV